MRNPEGEHGGTVQQSLPWKDIHCLMASPGSGNSPHSNMLQPPRPALASQEGMGSGKHRGVTWSRSCKRRRPALLMDGIEIRCFEPQPSTCSLLALAYLRLAARHCDCRQISELPLWAAPSKQKDFQGFNHIMVLYLSPQVHAELPGHSPANGPAYWETAPMKRYGPSCPAP